MREIATYYKLFRDAFGGNCGTILFLSSITSYAHKLFNASELLQDKPLALIVNSTAEFDSIFYQLRHSTEEKLLPTTSLPWKEVEKSLYDAEDRFVFCLYSTSGYCISNIDQLLALTENLERLPGVILVSFQTCMPEEYADRFISMQPQVSPNIFELTDDFQNWIATVVQYVTKNQDAILNSLLRFARTKGRFTDSAWLYASIEVASMMQGETATEAPLARQLKDDLQEALDSADGFQDFIGIPEAVIHCMQKHAMESKIHMYQRSEPPVSNLKELAKYPLYDDTYYYFSDQLFRQICEPLLNTLTLFQINEALARGGYQKSEHHGAQIYTPRQRGTYQPHASCTSRSNYTPKVTIYISFGVAIRQRFHVFNRMLTDANQEEPDLLDIYNNNNNTNTKKEGELYDKQTYLLGQNS